MVEINEKFKNKLIWGNVKLGNIYKNIIALHHKNRFLDISFLLGFYLILIKVFLNLGYILMKNSFYFSPNLISAAFGRTLIVFNITFYPFATIILITLILFLLNKYNFQNNYFYGKLSWIYVDPEYYIKKIVIVILLTFTWAFSTYEINHFYGESHLYSRILLIFLAFFVIKNPIFVLPYISVLNILSFQFSFNFPLFYSYTDKTLPLKILILFLIYMLIKPLLKTKPSSFFYLSLIIIANQYFPSFLKKWYIGGNNFWWVLNNNLGDFFVSSHINGWLGFLDESVIINISKYIEAVTVPLQFITLFIEAGFILLLIKRKFSILFLMGAIILHLGIFITTGIFFWHWMAVDAIFLYIIYTNYNSGWLFNLYSNASLKIISLLLILSTGTILEGEMLGWFDTKVNNLYIIEATDTNCEKYLLPPAFLSPYDFPISQNKFHFANEYPILVGGVGETGNKKIFEQINQSISTNDIAELFEKHGEIKSNPRLTEELVFFFERYFANLNLARKKYLVPQILTAPHHIWNQSIGNIYNFQAPIQNINLIYMETYFDGNEIHTIKNDVILSVPIQTLMSSACNN